MSLSIIIHIKSSTRSHTSGISFEVPHCIELIMIFRVTYSTLKIISCLRSLFILCPVTAEFFYGRKQRTAPAAPPSFWAKLSYSVPRLFSSSTSTPPSAPTLKTKPARFFTKTHVLRQRPISPLG